MPLYVLGTLEDEAQAQQVRDRLLTGDPVCAGYLAEAEATLAALPLALDPVAPSPQAKRNLLERVARASQPDGAPKAATEHREVAGTIRPRVPVAWTLVSSALAAAVAVLITWGVTYSPMQRQGDELRQVQADLAQKGKQIDRLEFAVATKNQRIVELETQVQTTTQTVNFLRSRRLIVASLDAGETQPENAWGRLFWDQDRGVWHFYASGMKPAGEGKTYELWFITKDQKKVPAGLFNVDSSGQTVLTVPLPPDIGPLAMAAVTDEPAGGVPQPTGSIQLVGALN